MIEVKDCVALNVLFNNYLIMFKNTVIGNWVKLPISNASSVVGGNYRNEQQLGRVS